MKSAVLAKYGSFTIEDRPVPDITDKQVLVKIEYASICGSDQHIFEGEFHPRTNLPLIPGHEFAGIIEKAGNAVKAFKKGQRVTVDPIIPCGACAACKHGHYPACTSLKLIGVDLDGGFSEYIVVDEKNVYAVPENIPPDHAALIELLSIGFHAITRAQLGHDESVVIYGAGKVGQSILQAVKTRTNANIFLVDIIEERLNMALNTFPDIRAINARFEDPIKMIMKETDSMGVDVAFEAVGHYSEITDRYNPVRSCIKSIRGGGTVCVLGLGDEPVDLLMKELIWKESRIIASRVSHGEFQDAISALVKNNLKPDKMITSVIGLDEVQKGFEMLKKHPEQHLKILIKVSRD